ncbi:hypothetical protein GCM10017691_08790 [Pseudonocardia petroleophila]|uniref:Uncharacterized protein n=1 Tax=Pseudonocardia petroleophila TaxID=37331 RepID=A0A7G7MJG3_9PSEU|nr:hypothetical protein [Pseudonocardia petroleophila]QNG52924.1 hypothetical protein H6H00_02430 [Pseudonocardia petroleophila]
MAATPEQLAPGNEAGVALAWSGILGRGRTSRSPSPVPPCSVPACGSHDHRLVDAVLGDAPASDRLLPGVEPADGRVATTGWPPADLTTDAASLVPGGGEGVDRSVDVHVYRAHA